MTEAHVALWRIEAAAPTLGDARERLMTPAPRADAARVHAEGAVSG
jgi:hypothetical protein